MTVMEDSRLSSKMTNLIFSSDYYQSYILLPELEMATAFEQFRAESS